MYNLLVISDQDFWNIKARPSDFLYQYIFKNQFLARQFENKILEKTSSEILYQPLDTLFVHPFKNMVKVGKIRQLKVNSEKSILYFHLFDDFKNIDKNTIHENSWELKLVNQDLEKEQSLLIASDLFNSLDLINIRIKELSNISPQTLPDTNDKQSSHIEHDYFNKEKITNLQILTAFDYGVSVWENNASKEKAVQSLIATSSLSSETAAILINNILHLLNAKALSDPMNIFILNIFLYKIEIEHNDDLLNNAFRSILNYYQLSQERMPKPILKTLLNYANFSNIQSDLQLEYLMHMDNIKNLNKVDYVRLLKNNKDVWNNYRKENRQFTPDLSEMKFSGINLSYANLQRADLTRATFSRATLYKTDITHSIVNQADFSGVDLSNLFTHGTSIATIKAHTLRADSKITPTNLDGIENLDQMILENIEGDSRTIIPENLSRPNHWPTLKFEDQFQDDEEAKSNDPSPFDEHDSIDQNAKNRHQLPFVFISHASSDKATVKPIIECLNNAGIETWWDDEIVNGDSWRATIQSKLNNSKVVLTLWSENSILSKAVHEEAGFAVKNNKLVHIKMDDCELPFGFNEVQYSELKNWDGTDTHHQMQEVVQAVLDKLDPKTVSIKQRFAEASKTAPVFKDGKIFIEDTPLDVPPIENNEVKLDRRLRSQITLAKKILDCMEQEQLNIDRHVLTNVQHYYNVVNDDKPEWFEVSDAVESLKHIIDCQDEAAFIGSILHDILRLIENTSHLQRLLEPEQLPLSSESSPKPMPQFKNSFSIKDDIPPLSKEINSVLEEKEVDDLLDEKVKNMLHQKANSFDLLSKEVGSYAKTKEYISKTLKAGIYLVGGFIAQVLASSFSQAFNSTAGGTKLIEGFNRIMSLIEKLF